MDIQNKTSIPYTETGVPPKSYCTPRSQVISLLALGILSGAVAIYAANFLIALPLTIVTLTIGSGLVSLISFIAAGSIGLCRGQEEDLPYRPKTPSAPPANEVMEEELIIANVHIETTEEVIIRLKSGEFPFTSYNREYITKVKEDLRVLGQEEVLFQAALNDPSMGTIQFKELGLYEESRKAEIIKAQIKHLSINPLDFFSFYARNQGSSLDDPLIKDAFCKLPYQEILLNNATSALLPPAFMGAFKEHVNAQVREMTFSQFLEFHRTPEVLRLLIKENALEYKAGFLEAVSASRIGTPSQTVQEFIANPSASLAIGMWLLEGNSQMLDALKALGAAVEPKHHLMLLKTFGLEALSKEFTEVCQGHAELNKDLQKQLQHLEARFSGEEAHLREASQDAEREMQLLALERIAKAKASFEENPAVKSFREAEGSLAQIKSLLKDNVKELQATEDKMTAMRTDMANIEAKLETLTQLINTRETRIEKQRTIITSETAKKESAKKATQGFATACRTLTSTSPEDKKIAKAEKTIRDIENEETKIAQLTSELTTLTGVIPNLMTKAQQLRAQQEQLTAEASVTTTRKQDLEPSYLLEKSTLDAKITAITQKLERAITSQKEELDKKLGESSKEKKRHVHYTKNNSVQNCKRTVYHQLNTVFIPRYNALFSS